MRLFKTKSFSRWAQKHVVTDNHLKMTAGEISEGMFEANLGGGVIKIDGD